MSDHCSECTPRSQPYCGFCGDGPYSPTGPFAARPRATQEPAPVSRESLLAEFDAMAAKHRAEAKRRAAGGAVSIEGGASLRRGGGERVGRAVGQPRNGAAISQPSDLDSPTPAPRCIANIPTTRKRVAHQCRNRAKYGPHCALHATGQTPPDLEQFPAALVEQPDNLPFAHDD